MLVSINKLKNRISVKDKIIKDLSVFQKEISFSHNNWYEATASVKQNEVIKAQMRAVGIIFIKSDKEPPIIINLNKKAGVYFANSDLIKELTQSYLGNSTINEE